MVLLKPKKRMIVMENEFDRILKNVRKESLDEGIDIGRSEGIDIGLKRGRNEGIEIGAKKNALHSARTMITDGALPLSKVAEYSGLTIQEVESLKNGIKA